MKVLTTTIDLMYNVDRMCIIKPKNYFGSLKTPVTLATLNRHFAQVNLY